MRLSISRIMFSIWSVIARTQWYRIPDWKDLCQALDKLHYKASAPEMISISSLVIIA